ncbi:MAG: hypothetical protein AAGK26_10825 [Pseudomonadota bacterium]
MKTTFWDLLSLLVRWRATNTDGKPPLGMEATNIDLVNKVQAENERLERINRRD